MIRADKVAHFVVSLILTIVLAIVIKSVDEDVAGIMCGILAGIVTMCLGVAKEVWTSLGELASTYRTCLLMP